ncbi:DNA polymerase IV [Denitratisoma sp. DHT3]|uniref:DNA polymerase IV n=1 Tax=Denitratisoma sp. DHT3 TaxID=1981880 RepID=UPI00119889A6|nr:DNA polymerase IV [Denitratisoma sp. DHT3]QDX82774.1 DNA polymerase IV [Denitratisoma sp. DHT3]
MNETAPRRIAHLDMDAFYASVELLRYPELKGLPVVIGGRRIDQPTTLPDGSRCFARLRDYVGRGVITTSTYEARALGVFSAMGLMKAARLAPDAILLPVDFDAYRQYSRRFKAAVAAIAPEIEDRGIDEIYIDLTALPGDSLEIGRRIKQAVREATGLSCSIAIAPNKLLAKIGSELQKPDGLTILVEDDIPRRIWPLAVSKINGVGPKATEKLAALGVIAIGDLARADPAQLQAHFGRGYGEWLHRVARGIDERPVITHSEPKSISRETTFERDLHPRQDRPALSAAFTALCEQVANDLARKGYVARTVGLKLRFDDFHTVTRDLTLPHPVGDAAMIRRAAGACLKRIVLEHRIRLLGVRTSSLFPVGEVADLAPAEESVQGELELFTHPEPPTPGA